MDSLYLKKVYCLYKVTFTANEMNESPLHRIINELKNLHNVLENGMQ